MDLASGRLCGLAGEWRWGLTREGTWVPSDVGQVWLFQPLAEVSLTLAVMHGSRSDICPAALKEPGDVEGLSPGR